MLTAAGFAGLLTQMPGGELLDAIQSKRTLAVGVRPPREVLWALGRMANGDGSSGHRHDASPLQGRAALSIVIGQKTQIGKDLQVSDFIQTSVSHRFGFRGCWFGHDPHRSADAPVRASGRRGRPDTASPDRSNVRTGLAVCSRSLPYRPGADPHLAKGERIDIEKIVALHTSRDRAIADARTEALTTLSRAGRFAELVRSHTLAWVQLWRRCDLRFMRVRSESDHHTHRIVRLQIFHLLQTVSPNMIELDAGVPARGWTGEAYRGHIFWDELFIFPFLNFRLPRLTRALLLYRWRRLPEARWAAREAGYRGAMFPWQSGSDGREETDELFLNPRSGGWIRDNSRPAAACQRRDRLQRVAVLLRDGRH